MFRLIIIATRKDNFHTNEHFNTKAYLLQLYFVNVNRKSEIGIIRINMYH
jgi:hypothetical protein